MTRVHLLGVAIVLLAVGPGCLEPGSSWNSKRGTTAEVPAPQTPQAPQVPQNTADAETNADPSTAVGTERRVEEFLNKLTRYDTDDEGSPAPAIRKRQDASAGIGPGSYEPVIPGRNTPNDGKPGANMGADLATVAKERPAPASAPYSPPAKSKDKPRIERVAIRSSAQAGEPARPEPKTMGVNAAPEAAGSPVDQGIQSMVEQLKRDVAGNSGDVDAMWRLLLLQMAMGQNVEAAELFKQVSGDAGQTMASTADLVRRVRQALREPGPATDNALAAIEDLRRRFARDAELVIPKVALCAKVSTFGVYDELSPSALVPNRANGAIVYCEVRNFVSEPAPDERFRVRLTSRLEILTAAGASVWKHEEAGIEDLSRQRREDFFLAQLVTFPPELSPGEYVLKVSIEDIAGAKAAEAVYPFRMGTAAVSSAAR